MIGIGLAVGLMLPVGGSAGAGNRSSAANSDTPIASPPLFKICNGKTADGTLVPHALCAVASCFVFNGLAYCKCDVEEGDSISLPFEFNRSGLVSSSDDPDICTVNADGVDNGYMASTYSLPLSVLQTGGDQALYTCPPPVSDGAYAQCDGGICFTSSEGQSFPGFDEPLAKNQIICSCPTATAKLGYQIAGPFPCQNSFFQNCSSATANTNTGATIYVGAPIGSARLLTRELYGMVPPLNECPSPVPAMPGPR
jgi:hypothetical protein